MAIVSHQDTNKQTSKEFENRWLGIKDAADYCGVSINKMRELFHRSNFPASKIGVRPLVKLSDLDAYIKGGLAS